MNSSGAKYPFVWLALGGLLFLFSNGKWGHPDRCLGCAYSPHAVHWEAKAILRFVHRSGYFGSEYCNT